MTRSFPSFPLRRFLLELTDGPFGSNLTGSHYSNSGARVIRLGNIGEAHFKGVDEAFIPLAYFSELWRHSVEAGDLLIAGLGDQGHPVGRACLAPAGLGPAIVKADCFRARLDEGQLLHRFAAWALNSRQVGHQVLTLTRGSTRARINLDVAKAIEVPVPPLEEQRAIADYLDRETARIDTLIEEQQRLIELLRERRSAVCVNAALHGLTPIAEVEHRLAWARSLPARWPVVPLTSVTQLESGHTPSRSREDWWTDTYIPWVSLHDVRTMRGVKYLQDTAQRISDAGIANSSARLLPAHTVVLSRDATVGRTTIMGVPMATSQHFAAWICGPLLDPEYLWVLFAGAMQPFFDSFQNGSTIRTIGMGDLKAFRIPLPPLLEQRRIVAYLDEQTAKIDALIAEAERFIELSRERRAALITAAVTGQIDVRDTSDMTSA